MTIEAMLSGGNPRSLGKTHEVVANILKDSLSIDELFACLFSTDEIVRLRASDALEKVCRVRPELIIPFTERLLHDVPRIRQPSVQWHLAQILAAIPLSPEQAERAVKLLLYNLHTMRDWIVTNTTLDALAVFVQNGAFPKQSFAQVLHTHTTSPYKSVAAKAHKLMHTFATQQDTA